MDDEAPADAGLEAPLCGSCKSEHVMRDAWATWNRATGAWELGPTYDATYCDACGETTLEWVPLDVYRAQVIRNLNDRLRQGRGLSVHDRTVMTGGVAAFGDRFVQEAWAAARSYSDFTPDNDPRGEHDFGLFEVRGVRLYWKIDYYDPNLEGGSEDPSDVEKTARVLTVLLAKEY